MLYALALSCLVCHCASLPVGNAECGIRAGCVQESVGRLFDEKSFSGLSTAAVLGAFPEGEPGPDSLVVQLGARPAQCYLAFHFGGDSNELVVSLMITESFDSRRAAESALRAWLSIVSPSVVGQFESLGSLELGRVSRLESRRGEEVIESIDVNLQREGQCWSATLVQARGQRLVVY